MTIAIVEDEKNIHEELNNILSDYFRESSLGVEIRDFYTGNDFLDGYKPIYDIILLDIQMPGFNGIDVAKKIREFDDKVIIIFITSLVQYALMGYKVQAFDYILKPVNYKTITFSLSRALHALESRAPEKTVLVNTGKATIMVPISEILYFEVAKHNFLLHTLHDTYPIKASSMRLLEEQYADCNFVRCNNCYLVNLRHVQSISNNILTIGNDNISISRPRKKEFLSALSNYVENL